MTSDQQFVFTLAAAITAGVSLVISALALGWNIYRDILLKPRLKLRFTVSSIIQPGFSGSSTTLLLSATNLGPGPIRCSMIQLRNAPLRKRLTRRTKYAVMLNNFANPLSGRLPATLEVGETVDLLIPYEQDCFLNEKYTHIGISDSFGRRHWAPSSDVAKARTSFQRDFPDKKG